MFPARYRKAIGAPWASVASRLRRPPTDGKYAALERYPLHDYQVLLDIAARERMGAHGSREAYRMLGRGEVEVFAESTLGKVALSMLKDPASALKKYPEALGYIAPGVSGYATVKGRSVTLTFPRFVGAVESTLGTFEGVVLSMNETPSSTIERDGPKVTFVVGW